MEINQDRLIKTFKTTDGRIIDVNIKNIKHMKKQIENSKKDIFKTIKTAVDTDADLKNIVKECEISCIMCILVLYIFYSLGISLIVIMMKVLLLFFAVSTSICIMLGVKEIYKIENKNIQNGNILITLLNFFVDIDETLSISVLVLSKNIVIYGYSLNNEIKEIKVPKEGIFDGTVITSLLSEDIKNSKVIYVRSIDKNTIRISDIIK